MNPETNGARPISVVAQEIEERRRQREQKDRSFELGGETFVHRASVPMEVMAEYLDMTNLVKTVGNTEAIEIIDSTVLAFLEPGQDEKWMKVRKDPENALTVTDCHQLIEGLLESLAARPTLPPSDSTDGQPSNGTNLTENSPSVEQTSQT